MSQCVRNGRVDETLVKDNDTVRIDINAPSAIFVFGEEQITLNEASSEILETVVVTG